MFMYGTGRTFVDRKDAGTELGKLLEEEYKGQDVVVLGVPRGGVEVAYYVAKRLQADLSVIVSKKLPYPGQEELAFGAVAEDGSVYLTYLASRLARSTVDRIIAQQLEESRRRKQEYRGEKELPDLKGRTVIIVDDGIATGSTIVPALKMCKAAGASKVVVAAPVAGERYASEIDDLADEVKIVETPPDFYAVGQVYEDFHGLTDQEVMDLLNDFETSGK